MRVSDAVEYTAADPVNPSFLAYSPRMDRNRMHDRTSWRAAETRFGFVMSRRIGDSLVSMVVVENLLRAGRRVVVWGDHLHALRRWFPGADIRPTPPVEARPDAWVDVDVLLHFRPRDVLEGTREHHSGVVVLDDLPEHRGPLVDMVTLHEQVSREVFGLENAGRDTGIRTPDGVVVAGEGADPRRIVIHPTASNPRRCWWPRRFEEVADRLRDRGWHPEFVTHPSEIESTAWIERAGHPRFATGDLDELAVRLAGSAGFFGSDSGVAHLASCVGLPWVALYVRRKVAIRWHPGWTAGEALRPVVPLVLKPLKERFWAAAIPVSTVMAAVDRVFGPGPAAVSGPPR